MENKKHELMDKNPQIVPKLSFFEKMNNFFHGRWLPKLFQSLKNQFHFSIFDIALSGMIMALWIVTSKFLTIDFGVMKAGLSFVWAMTLGLTLKLFPGIIVAIICDTVSLVIGVGIGAWMIEYAIEAPGIVFLTWAFKYVLKSKNDKLWWATMIAIVVIAAITCFLIAILKDDFKYNSQGNTENNIDFTKKTTKIVIFVFLGLFIITSISLGALAFIKPQFKIYFGFFALSCLIIIIFSWIWGTIGQIRYLIRLNGKSKHYWSLFDIYLIARLFKTPITAPLYTLMITGIYKANEQINSHFARYNRW